MGTRGILVPTRKAVEEYGYMIEMYDAACFKKKKTSCKMRHDALYIDMSFIQPLTSLPSRICLVRMSMHEKSPP